MFSRLICPLLSMWVKHDSRRPCRYQLCIRLSVHGSTWRILTRSTRGLPQWRLYLSAAEIAALGRTLMATLPISDDRAAASTTIRAVINTRLAPFSLLPPERRGNLKTASGVGARNRPAAGGRRRDGDPPEVDYVILSGAAGMYSTARTHRLPHAPKRACLTSRDTQASPVIP